jgi:dipeptidyl aminopeptidase/acylaminoacyl peptidase
MRYLLILSLILIQTTITQAQKKPLTDTSYLQWASVGNSLLSNDGKYVSYQINNSPVGKNTTVITSTNLSWERRFNNLSNPTFHTSRNIFFAMKGDTLLEIKMGQNAVRKISHCKNYQIFTESKTDLLIYQLDDSKSTLIVQDMHKEREKVYAQVQNYLLNEKASALIIQQKTTANDSENLIWLDLQTLNSKSIWKGESSEKHIFDQRGQQMAFSTEKNGFSSIYLYKNKTSTTQKIADDSSNGIANRLKISTKEIWFFDNSGKRIFLTLTDKMSEIKHKDDDPEVWNYLDQVPYPQYQKSGYIASGGSGRNLTVIDISENKIRQLLSGLQRVSGQYQLKMRCDSVFVYFNKSIKNKSLPDDGNEHISYYLYFVGSGKSIPLKLDQAKGLQSDRISPDNKYLVYFDPIEDALLSYNIATKITKNISAKVVEFGLLNLPRRKKSSPPTLLGWLPQAHSIWINGTYDIYQFDLDAEQPPLNLTQNEGERYNKVFTFNDKSDEDGLINNQKEYILWAFDLATKKIDFYKMNASKQNLKKIYSTNQYVRVPGSILPKSEFCKAANEEAYLFKFGSVNESPNYRFTKNFVKFTNISDIYPERDYNWFYSELMTYKDLDGNDCQGILYKPENFDPQKKYPVITYIYQEQANSLHQFISPEPSRVGFNIPILVNKGYLIFKPNVYQADGNFSQTLTSVLVGMDFLIKYDWVDSKNLALFGHSLGGYETSYIITKTSRFKAAVAAAPITNLTSYYTDNAGGGDIQGSYIRTILVDRLEKNIAKYIEYSPILYTQNISTPLLLMHNRDDGSVRYLQSSQMFNQLRSIQKPVWLVSYKNEGHTLGDLHNQLDFQRKVEDYFGHYLKGMVLPEWMSQPIKLQ